MPVLESGVDERIVRGAYEQRHGEGEDAHGECHPAEGRYHGIRA